MPAHFSMSVRSLSVCSREAHIPMRAGIGAKKRTIKESFQSSLNITASERQRYKAAGSRLKAISERAATSPFTPLSSFVIIPPTLSLWWYEMGSA
jgi:hypothetical protein